MTPPGGPPAAVRAWAAALRSYLAYRRMTLRYDLGPRYVAARAAAWSRDRIGRRAYVSLDEGDVRAARRSDTVFVCGSGRSLVDVTPDEWAAIAHHDVFSLRDFPRQEWVPAHFHMTAEVDFLEPYAERLRTNPRYADTIFIVQEGWLAESGNNLVGRRLLPRGARVFRFTRYRRRRGLEISHSFADGVVHGPSSITDAVNIAYLLGWRRIVLMGVDLYNKEYFWLEPGELRSHERPGIEVDQAWESAAPIVELLVAWRDELATGGVSLEVFNPRSLLAPAVPVFDRAELAG